MVPILKSHKSCQNQSICQISLLKEAIDRIVEMGLRGAMEFAEAFKEVGLFPDIVIQMISSGEESGDMDELLISTANYYDDQIDSEIKAIVSLINPISTVIVSLGVVGLLFAVFLPIFKMGETLG